MAVALLKLSVKELDELYRDWKAGDRVLRFGQLLVNNYWPGTPWPVLFYEQDHQEAYEIAYENIVLELKR